jgi:hypothetical protein
MGANPQQRQPEAWRTFNARSLLGGALLGQKKDAEAGPRSGARSSLRDRFMRGANGELYFSQVILVVPGRVPRPALPQEAVP